MGVGKEQPSIITKLRRAPKEVAVKDILTHRPTPMKNLKTYKLLGASSRNHNSAGERLRSRGVQSGIMKKYLLGPQGKESADLAIINPNVSGGRSCQSMSVAPSTKLED